MEKKTYRSKPKYVYLDKFERKTDELYGIFAENHLLIRKSIDQAKRKITYLTIYMFILTAIIFIMAYILSI